MKKIEAETLASQTIEGSRYDFILVPTKMEDPPRDGWRAYMNINDGEFEPAGFGWYMGADNALKRLASELYFSSHRAEKTEVFNPALRMYYGERKAIEEEKEAIVEKKSFEEKRQEQVRQENREILAEEFQKVKFSRVQIFVPVSEGREVEVTAYISPSVPGLFVHRSLSAPISKVSNFVISHRLSGMQVQKDFSSLEEAKFVAWRLAQIYNWDVPAKQISVKKLKSVVMKLRDDPYSTLYESS